MDLPDAASMAACQAPFSRPTGDLEAIREELHGCMREDVGILRTAEGLRRGLARLDALRQRLADCGIGSGERAFNLAWQDWLNLGSLIEVSRAIAKAAQGTARGRQSGMKLLFAADMGGTKSDLWLFERNNGRREIREEASLRSADFPNARAVVAAFLKGRSVEAGAVAIAGPVVDGRAQTPNLPWVVEQAAIARALGSDRVELLNDLAATAFGIGELDEAGLATLNEGRRAAGAVAVIAAGTGLGEAAIVTDRDRQIALPSEGGHADFAPGNETEIALLEYLARRHGHVSWERVVSGPGIHAIYDFLVATGRVARSGALAERMAAGDPSAAITRAAIEENEPAAVQALDIFLRLYGAEAGNLALKMLATGGVYVAGGIAPKILTRLRSGTFMEGFLAKGRHAELMQAIPVKVVLEPKTALIGAARRAEAILA